MCRVRERKLKRGFGIKTIATLLRAIQYHKCGRVLEEKTRTKFCGWQAYTKTVYGGPVSQSPYELPGRSKGGDQTFLPKMARQTPEEQFFITL